MNERPPGLPRWLVVSALVFLMAVVALLIVSSLLGIQHGPGLGPGGH